MEAELQKGDKELERAVSRHDANSKGGTRPGAFEVQQPSTANVQDETLTENLMDQICARDNLLRACAKVKANKGSPGIDGMTIQTLEKWLCQNLEGLQKDLIEGKYRPGRVLGIQIPKTGGGIRQLGIPTVRDRLVQQAILQVLEPILDPTFSESSYGFRPRRSAHQALTKASEYVQDGRTIVVDIDLEKFFDRVNHDILMARLARRIKDKKLLKLIRRFVEAGLMSNGVCLERRKGTPQGGPLSPLLANLLLDDLDKELEKRGHKFCRYADDCNIYVKTEIAGNRVMQSITNFLEKKLKLRINRDKSMVAQVKSRKFLGYRILDDGRLTIAPQSLKKAKERIRETTKRRRSVQMEQIIKELNKFTTGWVNYFYLAACSSILKDLDGWIRRKLRCFRLNQLKRPKTLRSFLTSRGIKERTARKVASSGKGVWRISRSQPLHMAMGIGWFESLGLQSCFQRKEMLLQN